MKSKYRASNPLINLEDLSNPESTYYDASALTAAKDGFIDDVLGYDEVVDCVNNAIDILADKRVSTLDKKHTVQSFS